MRGHQLQRRNATGDVCRVTTTHQRAGVEDYGAGGDSPIAGVGLYEKDGLLDPEVEVDYERHRPEETSLYRIVQTHYPQFLAQLDAEGDSLPAFVQQEFDDYLKCGLLEHGFLRVKCDGCQHEHLVAFSCKRRGFCPSCGARRMVDTWGAARWLLTNRSKEQDPSHAELSVARHHFESATSSRFVTTASRSSRSVRPAGEQRSMTVGPTLPV